MKEMKKNKPVLYCIAAIILLFSCNGPVVNDQLIRVPIHEMQDVSIFDIFRNIEIIPLDTQGEALLRSIAKLRYADGKYFIYDGHQPAIFIFDEKGDFVGKIQQQGMGPEEYYDISDFDLDTINRKVTLLCAADNRMFDFNFEGQFIRQYPLPMLTKASYMSFVYLNSDTIAFWTFDETNRLKFYSLKDDKLVHETFTAENNIFNRFGDVFSSTRNFFLPSDNHVYEISSSLSVIDVRTWHFSNLNNDEKKLKKNHNTYSKKDAHEVIEKICTSEIINYIFVQNGSNANYYYTQLYRKKKFINIFHHTTTGKNLVFEQTTEKANIFPIHWTDSYVIGMVPEIENTLDGVIPDVILNEANRHKKMAITEFDNPVMIKYYFK